MDLKSHGCLAVVIVTAFAVGCSPAQNPTTPGLGPAVAANAPTPTRIIIAVTAEPYTLISTINAATAGVVPGLDEVEQLVHAGLVQLNDRGDPVPQLAQDVPSIENSLWKVLPDGQMETTWTIRPNVVWHDGTGFTTADLVFTATVGRDKELPLSRHPAYAAISHVEAVDSRTITVRWTRPFIQADLMFSHELAMPFPKHLLEALYTAGDPSFLDLPYFSAEFVGTGPYKIQAWDRGNYMVLKAFEQYVRGRPKIDDVEIKFIPDSNTLVASLLSGTVDLTMGRGLSLDHALQIRDEWEQGKMHVSLSSPTGMYAQHINPQPAILGDARFRRALAHAIDRQQLVDSLLSGQSAVAHSFLAPPDAAYEPTKDSVVRFEYEPRRAMQIMESLGYHPGLDGFLRDARNQDLTVEIRAAATTDINEKSMLAVADAWQRIGIHGQPVGIPLSRARDREYRATFPGFDLSGGVGGDVGWLQRLYSSQAPVPENRFTGRNKARYMDASFDALIDQFFSTVPRGERLRLLGEIVHHISDQVVTIGLFYSAEPIMVANKLPNVSASKSNLAATSWNAHEWGLGKAP